jgi:2'-5' RNA ligase
MPQAPLPDPLIVTLALPPDAFAFFDDLRRRHFPPERNHLPAHATLFHAIPGVEEPRLREHLAARAAGAPAPLVSVEAVRFTGRGVSYALASPPLEALRRGLAAEFADRLTAQDAQGWRPHVTVQNKVEPRAARALHAALAADFAPFTFAAEGLLLWRYRGGPWEALGRFAFANRAVAA